MIEHYLLIVLLQFIGFGAKGLQSLTAINKRTPNSVHLKDIFQTFLREDSITILYSVLVLIANLTGHYIISQYTDWPETVAHYDLGSFVLALVLGYAGQHIFYKALGKAEKVITDRIDNAKV